MAEIWRAVSGWPGYSVSDLGRVWGPSGKVLKPVPLYAAGKSRLIAMHVDLSVQGVRTTRKVHHLVLETFVGPRPPGTECRHLDGDPANNTLANLCWGTSKDNSEDWKRHGTPGTKLSAEEVAEIRKCWELRAMKQKDMARVFGVSRSHISNIVAGRCWS